MPVCSTGIDPLAGMGSAVRRECTLGHPGGELAGLAVVEQIGVIGTFEHRQDRRGGIGWQGSGLPIGHTSNGLEIVVDPVARRGRGTTVTLNAMRLQRGVDIGKHRRRLRSIPCVTTTGRRKHGDQRAIHERLMGPASHWFGKNPPWQSAHWFVAATGCSA